MSWQKWSLLNISQRSLQHVGSATLSCNPFDLLFLYIVIIDICPVVLKRIFIPKRSVAFEAGILRVCPAYLRGTSSCSTVTGSAMFVSTLHLAKHQMMRNEALIVISTYEQTCPFFSSC